MPGAEKARSEASSWFVLLKEEPDDVDIRQRFDIWHAESLINAVAWESINETFNIMSTVSESVSPNKQETLIGTINQSEGYFSGITGKPMVAALAIACSILFLLILPTLQLRLEADHFTGAGEIATIQLDDSSVIKLGPNSAVSVSYEKDERHVQLLSGQAFFEVAKNSNRPFIIKAEDVTTTVVGTAFDVRMLGNETAVSVRNGHVRVKDSISDAYDLQAGDWIRIGSDHTALTGTTSPELVGVWQDGKILVRGREIVDVIDEISPWFSGKIILADSNIGKFRMTGVYDAHDPVTALQAL
ncbi:MAG: FecR domain-containing protein, partial [Emcibacteraceae bacterium]|nr:FecR domain-containing protein [Emcibacteraceae bacterium]